MNYFSKTLAYCLTFTLLFSCGDNNKSSDGNGAGADASSQRYVDTDKVAAEFNLESESYSFDIDGMKYLNINLHGFDRNVQIKYENAIDLNEGRLEVFSVSKNSKYSITGINIKSEHPRIFVSKNGSKSCSISIRNYVINSLEGACYIKIIVTIPMGARIEIRNVGKLKTARFFATSVKEFLVEIKEVFGRDKKMAVIDSFLKSYTIVNFKPVLYSHNIEDVLSEFNWKEQKFESLKKLHSFVQDRESLRIVIQKEFNYFQQEEAFKIVGLSF